MPLLPPGQIETRRFPVVGERLPLPEIADWSLTIDGLVRRPRALDMTQFMAMDHREMSSDVHCVTGWTRFETTFTGVPLAELVEPLSPASHVSFSAFSSRGHHTSLPLEYAMDHSWVVHSIEGEPLSPEHGGPVRVFTPGKYFYKSIKWLKHIDFMAEDRLGWWETNSSYHNEADPMTGDQRFTSGSLRPEQLRRFMEAESFVKYRGRPLIGLDLRSWRPGSKDLRRLHLKCCDMSGLELAGADLRGCNLSLSSLTGAALHATDLRDSDLEGADFTDADLTGADLSHAAMSAARFEGAKVKGARFDGVWGLVESQRDYLVAQGITL